MTTSFFPRNCFGCIHHADVSDGLGLSSRCQLYDEPIPHEVVAAADCPSFEPIPCQHTLTRWQSRTDAELGFIAWSKCVDCHALVTTLACAERTPR